VSQTSETVEFPPTFVVVVDSSVLIDIKKMVGINDQWDLLTSMSQLVLSGSLTFPKHVAKELAAGQHPDAPGAWVNHAKRDVRHKEPTEDTLAKVLEVAPEVVDLEATADREIADPYVAAMAVEIKERHTGCRVVVATNDVVDRLPLKLSLLTACERLDIEVCTPKQFIDWVRDGIEP
jgi:hypothetical protein